MKKRKIKKKDAKNSVAIGDSLINCVSGMNTSSDKRTYGKFGLQHLPLVYEELDAMYSESWLAYKVVSIIPEDMTRNWRTFDTETVTPEQKKEFTRFETMLGVKRKIFEALSWARLYGGAMVFPIIEDSGPLDEPFDLDLVKLDSLKNIATIDASSVFPAGPICYDITSPQYLRPDFYAVVGDTTDNKIHHSRLIRFDGVSVPRRLLERNRFWSQSNLVTSYQAIRDAESSLGAVASLLQEANIDFISVKNLAMMLAADQKENILDRIEVASLMKSNHNMMMLDSEEQLNNRSIQFAGLQQIVESALVSVAASTDIPVTRFLGTSAKGLNATGEGDLEHYYDSVSAKQENQLKTPLSQLDMIMAKSLWGEVPEDFEFSFVPLYQESALQKSQRELVDAQKDQIYLANNVVTEDVVSAKLKDEKVYPGISEEFIESIKALVNFTGENNDFSNNEENDE